ncbi:MAG: AraC family transcriptional regulator [Bacteroidetes bacterium]|nr:MAG: AraC family transcriptional regulator [Bacteroidota bacterium]
MSWCPYCNSVQSMLLGHVYCSRQSKGMGTLETGTLFIKAKSLEETDDHISRLSIRCMLNGEQRYRVGGHEHLVNPNNYLVVNQGQRYQTSFEGKEDQEMILVAFRPGFAENLLHALSTPEDVLLENPFEPSTGPVLFFEKTYEMDPLVLALFRRLRKLINTDRATKQVADLDGIYTALLGRLLQVHRKQGELIGKIGSSKKSTRVELFRRLSIARDYMEAHAGEMLKLDDIAHEACLSVHHFKRTFKELYGLSPHRFLIGKRIEKAERLLRGSPLPVDEICAATGFEDTSSFIRLFRQQTGRTPGAFRREKK